MNFHIAKADIHKSVVANRLIHKSLSQIAKNPKRKLKAMSLKTTS